MQTNSRYQVLTKQGFKDFEGIKKVKSNYNYTFHLTDGTSIKVTAMHRFIVGKGGSGKYERPAYKIYCGQQLSPNKIVKSVEITDSPSDFYDLINVEDNHSYLVEDIDNHNCDEMAWVEEKKMKAFLDSAMPALSSGKKTSIVFVSTPNGFNHFYQYAKEAKAPKKSQIADHLGTNGFSYLEYDYTCVPGRDDEWVNDKIAEEGVMNFNRNYRVKFLGSTATLIPPEKLLDLEGKCRNHIDTLDFIHHDFRVFEEYIKSDDIVYTVGCDSSKISETSKEGSDTFSIQVLKIDLLNRKISQVASLKTHEMHYTEGANMLSDVGKHYGDAWIFVENNSEGQSIADDLFFMLEYPNIYNSSDRNDVFGFRTTKTTRSIGVGNLRKLIRENAFIINDRELVKELYAFTRNKKGKYEAATELDHDDMIFACIAGLYWLQDNVGEFELTIHDFINKDRVLPDLKITENQNIDTDEDVSGMFFAG